MGDFRADIKLEMKILGKTYKHSMWINYWDNGDGIDARIVEWFAESYRDAKGRHWDHLDKERAKEQEKAERTELNRLKKKYETKP